ncbi:MAG: hypothetical protein WC558_03685 [Patulibacter sp.]
MSLPGLNALPWPSLLPRVELALNAVISLERTLRTLPDDIRLLQLELASVGAIHGELHAMRGDLQQVAVAVGRLHEEIGRLPPDVVHLRETVDAMHSGVCTLDERVASMGSAVVGVERIANRLAHPLRPRRAAKAEPEPLPQPDVDVAPDEA